jgi:hypothetical protein
MRYSFRNTAAFGLSILAFASIVKADDLLELKAQIVAAKEEAAELRKLGKTDEAEVTEREAEQLTEKAKRVYEEQQSQNVKRKQEKDRGDEHSEVIHLKQRLHELLKEMKKTESDEKRNELREEIGRVERELAEVSEHLAHQGHGELPPKFRERAEEIEMMAQRVQHVRIAAENLKAAEMHDMAHELMEKAQHMEREVHELKAGLAKEMKSVKEHREPNDRGELQELRAENKQLQRELQELRNVLEKMKNERKRD